MNDDVSLFFLRSLVERFVNQEISDREFCASYEQIWNFRFNKSEISPEFFEALDFLFDEVVFFSEFPREQWDYPKYRTGEEIRLVAAATLARLDSGSTPIVKN